MKNSRFSYLVIAIAFVIGFVVYSLFAAGIFAATRVLPIFLAIAAISTVLVAVLLGIKKDKDSFCRCGLIALVGGLGSIFLSIILALVSVPTGTIFFIFAAILFFLFALLLGGIGCYLYNANSCSNGRGNSCCCNCNCGCIDED